MPLSMFGLFCGLHGAWDFNVFVAFILSALTAPFERTLSSTAPLSMSADASKGGEAEDKVVVGGGCFWCTEAVFLQAPGVQRVQSGYAGGQTQNPSYREVVGGRTGHAECVEITFDPAVVSEGELYDLHLASHDPTQRNRQGVDVGSQYRSIILYRSEAQRQAALNAVAKAQEERSKSKFLGIIPNKAEVVTQVAPLDSFWPAESYHQDFFANNPYDRYSVVNIAPKLRSGRVRAKLRELEEAADARE